MIHRILFALLIVLVCVAVALALLVAPATAQIDDSRSTATPRPTETLPPSVTPSPTAVVVYSWHGYGMIEIVSPAETLTRGFDVELMPRIREALSFLAPTRGSWPPYLLQIGPCRLDGLACIIEARFDRMPTQETIADRLGSRLDMDRGSVSGSLRLTLFAPGGTWEESHRAVTAYLIEHTREWFSAEEFER